jgi:hypothetical protein
MPRWLGSLIMIATGIFGLYQGITAPCITLRGSNRPLPKWFGRAFYGTLAAGGIIGGLLAFFGPF